MKISIITVVFNAINTISQTLDSVLSQEYKNIEHIIVDGGSTDGTIELLDSYSKYIDVLIKEPDDGMYDALNKGLNKATGAYIGILNSDDTYMDNKVISDIASCLAINESPQALISGVIFIDPASLKTKRETKINFWRPNMLRFGYMPPHPGTFYRKDVYKRLGDYKLNYKIGADYEMAVRAFFVNGIDYCKLSRSSVRMMLGGMSTRDFKATLQINSDILKACAENNVSTNAFLLWLRLPLKFIIEILYVVLANGLALTKSK